MVDVSCFLASKSDFEPSDHEIPCAGTKFRGLIKKRTLPNWPQGRPNIFNGCRGTFRDTIYKGGFNYYDEGAKEASKWQWRKGRLSDYLKWPSFGLLLHSTTLELKELPGDTMNEPEGVAAISEPEAGKPSEPVLALEIPRPRMAIQSSRSATVSANTS